MNRSVLPLLISSLLLVWLSGCGADSAEEAREMARDAQDRVASEARELAERGKEFGQSMMLEGKELSDWSLEEMGAYAEALRERYGDDVNATGAHVNELLDRIARDPNEDVTTTDKVGRMIVLMIPFVGPTTRYIDARKLYEVGQAEQDAESMRRARRETLIACAEAGLDIGTLGLVGSRVDLVATGADRVLVALKLSRSINVLVGEDLKTLDDLLDHLLEQEDVRTGVDNALTVDLSMIVPSA